MPLLRAHGLPAAVVTSEVGNGNPGTSCCGAIRSSILTRRARLRDCPAQELRGRERDNVGKLDHPDGDSAQTVPGGSNSKTTYGESGTAMCQLPLLQFRSAGDVTAAR